MSKEVYVIEDQKTLSSPKSAALYLETTEDAILKALNHPGNRGVVNSIHICWKDSWRSKSHKPVRIIETGKTYTDVTTMSYLLGCSASDIYDVLKGRKPNFFGYHLEYC